MILIISFIVIVLLAGGFVLLQNQKIAGMQEKDSRLILNNPKIEIIDSEKTESFQYSNGSMPLDCCAEDWQRIRLDKLIGGGQSRLCLFAHPRNNATVNLIYEKIRIKKAISFNTAIADIMVTGQNSPVYIDVYINDVFLERITQLDKRGWFAKDVSTENYENKLADIKLAISSDNNFQRHFCFDTEIID